ncbi:telomere binding protein, partial [Tulasnella sp. 427]
AGDPPLRTIISDLRKPIHALDALKTLLQSALAELSISLVGSSKTKKGYQDSGAQFSASEVRYILPLQDVILQQIVPTWHHLLSEEDSDSLVDLLLNPPSENNRSAPLVAVQAHTSLLSALRTSTAFAVNLLERLTEDWPSEKLHFELFSNSLGLTDAQLDSIWSDYLRAFEYFTRIVTGAERLLEQWARSNPNQPTSDSLAQLVLKLVNTGFFPPTSSPTQPSFFQTNYAAIQKQLRSKTSVQPDSNVSYTGIWSSILSSLPAPVVHKIATSLLGSMAWEGGLEYSPSVQRKISNNVRLLRGILGRLDANRTESWDLVSAVVIERPWPEQVAMALSQWAGGAELNESEKERSLGELLKRTLELWTSAQHVKFSLLSRHHYATALLLFTCALLPPASPALKALMSNQKFMSAIALYIGHTDPSIRHCGMLAAEWIAQRLGQKLKFDGWDEPGEGREWCRQLRKLLDDGFVVYSNSEEDEGNEETVEPEQVPSPPSDKQDPPTAPDQPTLYDSDDSLT